MSKIIPCVYLIFSLVCFVNKATHAQAMNMWRANIFIKADNVDKLYHSSNSALSSNTSLGGSIQLEGALFGAFEQNSAKLKLMGGEALTYKNGGANACGATLYYLIYPSGSRPLNPTLSSFSKIYLPFREDCSGPNFNAPGYNLGCSAPNGDQKWLNNTADIDLTTRPVGNYTIEFFYGVTGSQNSSNCDSMNVSVPAGLTGTNPTITNPALTASFSITPALFINGLQFSGIGKKDKIEIFWQVNYDIDVEEYVVQKSNNGLNYIDLAVVSSKKSLGVVNYLYYDMLPNLGVNFYRLKIKKTNQTINFSKIIRVNYRFIDNSILVFPTPTSSNLHAKLIGINKGNYNFILYNNNGQTIYRSHFYHDGSERTIFINTYKNLPAGIYWAYLSNENNFFKTSFVVTNK